MGLDATREEARLHRMRGEELEAEVQVRTAQLARSQRAVIDLLASCAEFRDEPLGPHTRWVGDAAQAVALALGSAPPRLRNWGWRRGCMTWARSAFRIRFCSSAGRCCRTSGRTWPSTPGWARGC